MTVAITTRALNNNLITLADLKVAIAPGSSDDVYLASLIARASQRIENYTRRRFAREVVTETLNGSGSTELMVSRFPIANIGSISFDDTALDSTAYKILGNAGMIFREVGWTRNTIIGTHVTVIPLNQQGDLDWSVVYTGGYILPTDDFSSALVTVSESGKTFTLSTGTWPLLVDGDTFTFTGSSSNDGTFTVASRTATVLTVDETPADEAEASTFAFLFGDSFTGSRLPQDIEQACIDAVGSWFSQRSRDKAVKMERIGDYAVTYGDGAGSGDLPASVKDALNRYKVIF